MPSLKADLQQLIAVQEVDSRIDRIKAALDALDTGAALADRFNTGKVTFERQKAEAVKGQAAQKDAELALETLETKIKKVTNDLYDGHITGARELKNLQSELDMLKRQKDDAEGKVLAAMSTASTLFQTAQQSESALRTVADQYKRVRAEFKQKHGELSAEVAAAEKERALVVQSVSPAVLTTYQIIRGKRKGIGVGPLAADSSCGVCHTKLNSSLVAAVRAAETIQTCEYCGRILAPIN